MALYTPQQIEQQRRRVERLVEALHAAGLVVTIEQKPLLPLAMGNHKTVVSVRERRGLTLEQLQK